MANHLREIEAARLRAGEPRRSIRLHFHFDRRLGYFIFGEEGYVNANDPFDPDKFPLYGWRADRWREIREEQERQDTIAPPERPARSTSGREEPPTTNRRQHTHDRADAPGDNKNNGQRENQGPDDEADTPSDQGSDDGKKTRHHKSE